MRPRKSKHLVAEDAAAAAEAEQAARGCVGGEGEAGGAWMAGLGGDEGDSAGAGVAGQIGDGSGGGAVLLEGVAVLAVLVDMVKKEKSQEMMPEIGGEPGEERRGQEGGQRDQWRGERLG